MNEKVTATITKLIELFKNPAKLPSALAQTFFDLGDSPAANRSWGNKLLSITQSGTIDLRTYKQWASTGRYLKPATERKNGTPYILAPMVKRYKKEGEDGKEQVQSYCYGFRVLPVYPVWDTKGDENTSETGLEGVPEALQRVAKAWGIDVTPVSSVTALAWYSSKSKMIGLASKNLSSFAHELVHAAEDRLGRLTKIGQDPAQEIVAELGGAVLLTMLGYETDADLGGAYQYVKRYAGVEAVRKCNGLINRIGEAVSLIISEGSTS